ncbi:MAG: dephospho-CoA kinase [Candidatus Gastranaerophilaceae bacterium]|jgi:dephospho-CoA kinase
MLKIGLTGNIACGKSLIETMLKEMDIPTVDSDQICHNQLDFDKETIKKVKKLFDDFDILSTDGKTLDRYKIGQIIFNDISLKKALEAILHPQVIEIIKKFFQKNKDEKIAVASVPLLFENELEYLFDKLILVTADQDIQLERLVKRNGFDEEHAKARINSQMNQHHKKQKADYIIDNSGTIEETKRQLEEIINKILLK